MKTGQLQVKVRNKKEFIDCYFCSMIANYVLVNLWKEPFMQVTAFPSQFIFPDEDIVFDIQIAHNGEHFFSNYLLSQDFNEDGGALTTRLDNGVKLNNDGNGVKLFKGEVYHRQVRVRRSPGSFEFPPVELTLKSKCQATKKVTVPLYNVVSDDGTPSLKWIEPCPTIQWAGELKRDQSFFVNTLSADPDFLSVTVFNPNASKKGMKLSEMTAPDGRLENAYLFYRLAGEVTWNIAKNETINDVDYSLAFVDEDNFGYSTLKWNLGAGPLPDGIYEIVIETRCSDVGGPDDFSFSRENTITGVIDLTRPEQYGQPLPYREDVVVGEEILVVFTEPLDCSLPLSFDVQMTVEGLDRALDKNDLFVICEGRSIGIQVDLSVGIEPSQLIGKAFEVEIGQVGDGSFGSIKDVNQNPMDPLKGNVRFIRRFGDLDLSSASTAFTFSRRVEGVCDEFGLGNHLEDEMRSTVASTIGMENVDTIVIEDLLCEDTHTLVANIELQSMVAIAENKANRGLGSSFHHDMLTSFDLYRMLQDNIASVVVGDSNAKNGRKLESAGGIVSRSVKIIPGSKDRILFETNVDKKEAEDLMYQIARMSAKAEVTNSDLMKNLETFERSLEDGLMNNMKREKEDDIGALEERLIEELKMERKEELKEIEERILSNNNRSGGIVIDMLDMFLLQGLTFLIGCSITAGTIYFVLMRRK